MKGNCLCGKCDKDEDKEEALKSKLMLNGFPNQGKDDFINKAPFVPFYVTRKVTVLASSTAIATIPLSRSAKSYLMAAYAGRQLFTTYQIQSKAYDSGSLVEMGVKDNPLNFYFGDEEKGIPLEEYLQIAITNNGLATRDYEVKFWILSTERIPNNANTGIDDYDDNLDDKISLYDYSGTLIIYEGYALPGTSSSSSYWLIKKNLYSGSNNIGSQYASGTRKFDKIWDNRASYTYS